MQTQIKKLSVNFLLAISITLVAAGCNYAKPNSLQKPKDTASTNTSEQNQNGNTNTDDGQVAGVDTAEAPQLNLMTKTISVVGHDVKVEIADSDAAREQGLSDREKLDDGNGMLFDFTNTDFSKPGFWMNKMNFPIDIIWISNGKIIGVQKDAPVPSNETDLPVYYPPSDITHVLEVPSGYYDRNNLKVNDDIKL